MKKVVFVVNVDWFFVSHRLSHALALQKQGYKIVLISNIQTSKEILLEHGIEFHHLAFERSGTNILKEFFLLIKLFFLYKKINPDVVHHVTLKPVIYGNLVSVLLTRKIQIINAISGLGYNFIGERRSISISILKTLMKLFLKGKNRHFIFQNNDDLMIFKRLNIVEKNYTIIKGSGADASKFPFSPPPKNDKINILFPARILKDKGIYEFTEAANFLFTKYGKNVVFQILGDIDLENNASISEFERKKLLIPNYIEWLGHHSNVVPFLKNADIVCLPSYREGLPKSLVEAMSIGRPIITTDAPGCRECVEESINGYIVPIKNSNALAQRLEELILDKNLRIKMGQNSRKKFEEEFSLEIIINQTLNLYKSLD